MHSIIPQGILRATIKKGCPVRDSPFVYIYMFYSLFTGRVVLIQHFEKFGSDVVCRIR